MASLAALELSAREVETALVGLSSGASLRREAEGLRRVSPLGPLLWAAAGGLLAETGWLVGRLAVATKVRTTSNLAGHGRLARFGWARRAIAWMTLAERSCPTACARCFIVKGSTRTFFSLSYINDSGMLFNQILAIVLNSVPNNAQ